MREEEEEHGPSAILHGGDALRQTQRRRRRHVGEEDEEEEAARASLSARGGRGALLFRAKYEGETETKQPQLPFESFVTTRPLLIYRCCHRYLHLHHHHD